ncbi:hypothetical protein DL767_009742 [Monosporascus sp. MG133]|nr:hypothetical protein DL767_009742 [Monosporascus sp. MG133]
MPHFLAYYLKGPSLDVYELSVVGDGIFGVAEIPRKKLMPSAPVQELVRRLRISHGPEQVVRILDHLFPDLVGAASNPWIVVFEEYSTQVKSDNAVERSEKNDAALVIIALGKLVLARMETRDFSRTK